MSRALHTLRRLLTARRPTEPAPLIWQSQHRALVQATLLVRLYYLILFCTLLQLYSNWNYWLHLKEMRLLWPVAWFAWTGTRAGVAIAVFGSLAAALLAGCYPGSRSCRILAAVFVLFFAAFSNSFGTVVRTWHAWVWISAVLVLLPDGPIDHIKQSTIRAQRYLRIFWSAQAAMLLFYSMSGGLKLAAVALQFSRGEVTALHPQGLARHIAARLLEGTAIYDHILGPFIVRHPYAGWPLLAGAIYFEAFSFLVAFRPATQRLWGIGLILVHVGAYFTLTIMFTWQMLLLSLFLVASPFAPTQTSVVTVLHQLPLIGDALAWFPHKRKTLAQNISLPHSPDRTGASLASVPRADSPSSVA